MLCIHIGAFGSIDPFPLSLPHRVIGNNGILRKRTRIAIVNEFSLVECMDRIILMRNREGSIQTTSPTPLRSHPSRGHA